MRTALSFNQQAAHLTGRCAPGGGGWGQFTVEQKDGVFGGVEATFANKLPNIREGGALVRRET